MASEKIAKPPKIFISHCSSDRIAAEAVVDFLEDLGVKAASIVCTSVPDTIIPNGEKIYDWLRAQFDKYQLHVFFLLSKAYYESPDCLNEMGAAWVTRTKTDIILLPGFSPSDIRGCIGTDTMAIYWDGSLDILEDRLYQMKRDVCAEFGLDEPADRRWKAIRAELIEKVKRNTLREPETEDHIRDDPAKLAAHIVDIKTKIEAAIVNTSWVNTHDDHLRIVRDRPSQFSCNNLILKDPTIPNPDINNGLIKVEPYDFSDDGMIVIVPRGDIRKKIEVQGRGIVEVDIYSEVLFRDILEVQERGSIDWPQPTFFCRFTNGNPFHRDVYYDAITGFPISEEKIVENNLNKPPKLEVKLLASGGGLGNMVFSLTNASSVLISGIKVTGMKAQMENGQLMEVGMKPEVKITVLKSGESTEISLNNDIFGNGSKSGLNNLWSKFTAVLWLECEDENDYSFLYKVSKEIDKTTDNNTGLWDVMSQLK